MDTHELAWAAGLFDGEGSVFATKFVKRGRDRRLDRALAELEPRLAAEPRQLRLEAVA